MARTDNLAENKLTTMIAGLQADLTELKNRQRTSGRSGVLSYLTQNSNTWDLTGTIGSDSDTSSRTTNFTVTYTGDGSQSPFIANVSFILFVNGTDSAHQLTPIVSYWSDGAGHDASLNYNGLTVALANYTQKFFLITDKRISFYIKAYAVGSSRGTVVVTSP